MNMLPAATSMCGTANRVVCSLGQGIFVGYLDLQGMCGKPEHKTHILLTSVARNGSSPIYSPS